MFAEGDEFELPETAHETVRGPWVVTGIDLETDFVFARRPDGHPDPYETGFTVDSLARAQGFA